MLGIFELQQQWSFRSDWVLQIAVHIFSSQGGGPDSGEDSDVEIIAVVPAVAASSASSASSVVAATPSNGASSSSLVQISRASSWESPANSGKLQLSLGQYFISPSGKVPGGVVQITPRSKGRPKKQKVELTEETEQLIAEADMEEELKDEALRSVQHKVSSRGGRPVAAFSAEAVQIEELLGTKR